MPSDVLITPASSKIDFTDGANATKTLKITGTSLNIDTSFAIGATTANNTLSVLGSASIGSAFNVAAPTNGLIVQGDTGIGTSSFVYSNANRGVLEIYGTTDSLIALKNATANSYLQKSGNDFYLVNGGAGIIAINTNGLERWRITSAGVLQSNGAQTVQTNTGNLTLASAAGNGHVLLSPNGTGNVGIGTATPSQKLEVQGNIKLGADNAGSYIYYVKDNEGTIINTSRSDVSQQGLFRSDGWGNFTVDKSIGIGYSLGSSFASSAIGNGNLYVLNSIGINTTSPLTKLDVRNGSITSGTATSTSGSTIIAGYYTAGALTVLGTEQASGGPVLGYAVTPSTSATGAFLSSTTITIPRSAYTQDGGTHRWYIGASQTVAIGGAVTVSEVMRINSNGNLGIGINSPTAKLEIASNVAAASTPASALTFSNQSDGGHRILFKSSTGNLVAIDGDVTSTGGGTDDGVFKVFTSSNGSLAERMRITNNGLVGIGTTSPFGQLDVYENVNGGSISYYRNVSSGSSAYIALLLGNDQGGNKLVMFTNSSTRTTDGGVGNSTIRTDSGKLYLGAGATQHILDTTGNVGIGNTSPNNKLAISGSVSIGNNYNTAAPTNGLIVEGNVGIGVSTLNAGAKLHVVGNADIGDSTADTGIIVRHGSGSAQYGRIRFYSASTNIHTIHSFPTAWNSGTFLNASAGAMNLQGTNGITFGSWNSIDVAFAQGGNNYFKGNIGIGITVPSATLHLNSTTSGATLLRADGTNGTLFSVVDDLSDSLMSVNNSAGLPVLEVFADDRVVAGQYGANDFVLVNNKIGIGNSNPSFKLDVNGTFNATGTSTLAAVSITGSITSSATEALRINNNNGYISIYNSAGTTRTGYIQGLTGSSLTLSAENSAVLRFLVDGSERARIDTNGNLGVGTTTAYTRTHIYGTLTVDAAGATVNSFTEGIRLGAASNGYSIVTFGVNAGASSGQITNQWWIGKHGGDNSFNFNSQGGGDVFRILQGGNVGIGNTTPGYKLHVNGNGYFNSTLQVNSNITLSGGGDVIINDSDGTGTFNSFMDSGVGYIRIDDGGSANGTLNINSGTLFVGPSSGNVGVGTITPTAKLQIGTNSSSVVGDNSSIVRIGSSNAGGRAYNLTLANTAAAQVSNDSSMSFIVAGNYSATSVISAVLRSTVTAATDLVFTNYNNGLFERMRIKFDGNIGIGTSGPDTLLQVGAGSPTASGSGIQFGDDTGTRLYRSASGIVTCSGTIAATFSGNLTGNVTGNATNVTGTVAIANGGSGQTSAQAAMNAFAGAVTSGSYLRGNGTNVVMSAIQAADVPALNQNTTGNAATATTSDRLTTRDNRTISPSEDDAYRLRFGFTSWANDNSSPYADYLHLRSYSDSSGGNDNLVMFRKDAIGMRIYQAGFGTSVAYSSFKDVAFTDQSFFIGTTSVAINRASAALTLNGVNISGTAGGETFATVTGRGASTTTQISVATAAGGSMYTGTKVGTSYGDGISGATFKSITDNPNGGSYAFAAYFNGVSGTNSFYVGADGSGYFRSTLTTSVIKGDSGSDYPHSFTNADSGSTHWTNRGGRLLTSNGAGWQTDGRDPIMALVTSGNTNNTNIANSIGLALHNESQTNNTFSPAIAFSNLSNSGSYNTTYAAIIGRKTGQGVDTNWSAGELHFYTMPVGAYKNNIPSLIINSAANIGIGTTNPVTLLQVGTGTPTASGSGIQFGDDTTARLYRSSSGVVSVSNSFAAASGYVYASNYLQTGNNLIYPASFSATQRLEIGNTAQNAWITGISIAPGGNVVVAGTLTESSSIRYKENIQTVSAPILPKLNEIRPVTYNKKDNPNNIEYGIIAEELNDLFPELVNKNNNGEVESVNYSRLTVLLIKAVKELKQEIEILKNK